MKKEKCIAPMDFAEYLKKSGVPENSKTYWNERYCYITLGCLIEDEGLNCWVGRERFQNLISGRILLSEWVRSGNFTKSKKKTIERIVA